MASAFKTGFTVGSGGLPGTALACVALTCGTGFTASVSKSRIMACFGTGNTTDLSATSLSGLHLVGNSFATVSLSANTYTPVALGNYSATVSSAAAPSWTPSVTNGQTALHFVGSYTAGAQALTVNNPTNTGELLPGTLVFVNLTKTGANDLFVSWGTNWVDEDLSAMTSPAAVSSNTALGLVFIWTGSAMRRFLVGQAAGV